MKRYLKEKNLTNVIKLPASTILHHSDAAHIEKRRSELENYLHTMYTHLNPLDIPEFDNFLLYEVSIVSYSLIDDLYVVHFYLIFL